jgi:hypothetical protein
MSELDRCSSRRRRDDLYPSPFGVLLLQATKNAIAANSSFASKRKHYAESSFILTKEVAASRQWGPTEIDVRQKRLAEIAVKTWPTDKLD